MHLHFMMNVTGVVATIEIYLRNMSALRSLPILLDAHNAPNHASIISSSLATAQ